MQLFQTDHGVARRRGDALEVLAGLADLHTLIVDGSVAAAADAPVTDVVPLDGTALSAPVRPRRLIQVGLNYHSHLAEIGMPAPERPMYAITDVGDALGGPGGVVTFPAGHPDEVDHECELAVVIGAPASRVAARDAWGVVAGVTACNDVSARDIQKRGFATGDNLAGKMLPGFKPLGPGLLTADEAASGPIPLRLAVNGEVRQDTDSGQMVVPIPDLVAAITAEHDLVPGDVIMTGSPAGVGFFTGRYLVPGDVVEIWLGPLPPLRTTFEKG
jgi:2-keto-4-pentenoate hydratase/2-oxohepta-3-ene-1,7-dioic acid hydratase in catechol pathway